ncbi:hypothetical protein CHS0354_015782 [Potamilus streckersoni]|uniref:Uncharacterized protein n=1 Tax=Potamilus streckersoni TaxID=2493646 RepID=A0AAE0T3T5_9BIVA|nr:hypothetical protein CHS0354_015782 [Potamilus streckersoni]
MEQESHAVIYNEEPSAPPTYSQSQKYGQSGAYDQSQGYAHFQGQCQPGGRDKTRENMHSKVYEQQAGPEIITRQNNVAHATPRTFVVTSRERPPDQSVLAWFVCLCCFWPTGILAIIYASQANNEVGNEAWKKYRLAMVFIIASFLCGLTGIAFGIWRVVSLVNS